jgi:hypothetical protein
MVWWRLANVPIDPERPFFVPRQLHLFGLCQEEGRPKWKRLTTEKKWEAAFEALCKQGCGLSSLETTNFDKFLRALSLTKKAASSARGRWHSFHGQNRHSCPELAVNLRQEDRRTVLANSTKPLLDITKIREALISSIGVIFGRTSQGPSMFVIFSSRTLVFGRSSAASTVTVPAGG